MNIPIAQDLNWKGLEEFMNSTGLEFEKVKFSAPGALGLAVPGKVYVSDTLGANMHYMFAVLHEIAHCKRYEKVGPEVISERILNGSFDEAFAHILYEEQVADRYAAMMFRKINGVGCPRHLTQQLDDENKIAGLANNWYYIRPILLDSINEGDNYFDVVKSFALKP